LQKYRNAVELLTQTEISGMEGLGMEAHYVTVQKRGLISLPVGLRKRYHLDEAGAQVAICERADGVIELRPQTAVPADQRWFWTEHWQGMEREAEDDIAAERVETFDDAESFVADLDA
jgi:bifunctional DNA-binding transcriptional regulator/antitoxin component of YhaV-PrlF toxin-antitoxin module